MLIRVSVVAVSSVLCGAIAASASAQQTDNTTFRRLQSFCGSGVNFPGARDWVQYTAPQIGQAVSADGQVAYSPFPWMPGGMNALTEAATSTPVHPTLDQGLVDAHACAAWLGWGYGPWGGGTHGGFTSSSLSSGDFICNTDFGMEVASVRFVHAYVYALRTGPNVIIQGRTGGLPGQDGANAYVLAANDQFAVWVNLLPNGDFQLMSQAAGDPAPTVQGDFPIVNHLFVMQAPNCGQNGWWFRSEVAGGFALNNPSPMATGGSLAGAHGWQVARGPGMPQPGLLVIQNPDLSELPDAPEIEIPEIPELPPNAGGGSGSGSGGSGSGGSGSGSGSGGSGSGGSGPSCPGPSGGSTSGGSTSGPGGMPPLGP
jgi:hypothetical protein